MVHGQQGVQRFIAERLPGEGRVAGHQAAAHVQFTVENPLFDRATAAFQQLDGDIGITPAVLGKQSGEQRITGQQRQAQAQFSTGQLLHVVQLAEQFGLQAQHRFGALQHHGAGGGQADMCAGALQQRRTEALFQLCHLFAHGGLTDVQGSAGLGKATAMDDFDKAAQLFEFHGHDSRLE